MLTAALRGITGAVSRMPLPRALALGRCLGAVFGSVVRYHRADALDALGRAFPEKNPDELAGIVRRMYRNLGMNLIETLRLVGGATEGLDERVTPVGIDIVHAALARGRGALALTAHLGSWDLLTYKSVRLGLPLTVITKDVKNRALNDFWMEGRRRFGLNLVPARNSYRTCLRALSRGGIIGFVLDQNVIRKEGVFVDFFGRPACTTAGLAFMAAHSQAPVFPGFLRRTADDRHEMRIHPLLEPPPDREPETIRQATQQYTKIVEDAVRAYPDQWTWIHRRWRTQPAE